MTTHFVKIDNTDPRITYVPVLGPGPFHGQGWSNAIGASEDPATQGPIFNNTLEVGMFESTSIVFPFSGEWYNTQQSWPSDSPDFRMRQLSASPSTAAYALC